MNQGSFEFPLTKFEEVTARYFSEGKKPNEKHIALAVKKCLFWNTERMKKGLKPYS